MDHKNKPASKTANRTYDAYVDGKTGNISKVIVSSCNKTNKSANDHQLADCLPKVSGELDDFLELIARTMAKADIDEQRKSGGS